MEHIIKPDTMCRKSKGVVIAKWLGVEPSVGIQGTVQNAAVSRAGYCKLCTAMPCSPDLYKRVQRQTQYVVGNRWDDNIMQYFKKFGTCKNVEVFG